MLWIWTEGRIRRYLLGNLSEKRRLQFEKAYFTNENLFERLQAAEDDLIEDYVTGALSPELREAFERHFQTSPEQLDRIAFARALRQSVSRAHLPSRSQSSGSLQSRLGVFGFVYSRRALTALGAALVVATGTLMVRSYTRSQAGSQVQQTQPAPPPLVTPKVGRSESTVLAITLSPSVLRGDESGRFARIRPTDQTLRVQLVTDSAQKYTAYPVRLETPEGKVVWSGEAARPPSGGEATSPSHLVVGIPADRLPDGDYIVFLQGRDGERLHEVTEYSLSVRRPR